MVGGGAVHALDQGLATPRALAHLTRVQRAAGLKLELAARSLGPVPWGQHSTQSTPKHPQSVAVAVVVTVGLSLVREGLSHALGVVELPCRHDTIRYERVGLAAWCRRLTAEHRALQHLAVILPLYATGEAAVLVDGEELVQPPCEEHQLSFSELTLFATQSLQIHRSCRLPLVTVTQSVQNMVSPAATPCNEAQVIHTAARSPPPLSHLSFPLWVHTHTPQRYAIGQRGHLGGRSGGSSRRR